MYRNTNTFQDIRSSFTKSIPLFSVLFANIACDGEIGKALSNSCPALSARIAAFSGYVDSSTTEQERQSRQDTLTAYLLQSNP